MPPRVIGLLVMRAYRQNWCDVPELKLSFTPSPALFYMRVCVCVLELVKKPTNERHSAHVGEGGCERGRYDSSNIKVTEQKNKNGSFGMFAFLLSALMPGDDINK